VDDLSGICLTVEGEGKLAIEDGMRLEIACGIGRRRPAEGEEAVEWSSWNALRYYGIYHKMKVVEKREKEREHERMGRKKVHRLL